MTPKRPNPKFPPRLPAKPVNDGFVVFEVDGFAQLTPEQRTWPVVDFNAPPKPVPPAESTGPGTGPSPPG